MNNNSELRKYYEGPAKIIKLLIKNGFKIDPLKKWSDFLNEKLSDHNQKDGKSLRARKLKKKEIEKIRSEYFKKIKNDCKNILKTLDIEKASKVIVKEQAKELVNKNGFIANGFVIYINQRVFEIDTSAPLEVIMYKLIFEWYELSEEKREVYRKIAKSKMKSIEKDFNSLKDGLIQFDSSEIDLAFEE